MAAVKTKDVKSNVSASSETTHLRAPTSHSLHPRHPPSIPSASPISPPPTHRISSIPLINKAATEGAESRSHAGPALSIPYPSPLPLLSLEPTQVAPSRARLTRRRSSYPLSTPPNSSGGISCLVRGTRAPKSTELRPGEEAKSLPGFGGELSTASGMAWESSEWEGLLDFDLVAHRTPTKASEQSIQRSLTASPPHLPVKPTFRAQSDPGSEHVNSNPKRPTMTSNSRDVFSAQPPSMNAGRLADLAWKTILNRVVDVEGVGEVGVCRVLQEVWKRGGGEAVTSQCLWPNIVMSLALQPSDPLSASGARIHTPSAQASMGLQQLYNLTLRHWEPAVFSGLLTAYSSAPSHLAAATMGRTPTYGPSTPTKDLDASLSQWTNFTPGLGDLSSSFDGSSGLTPRGSFSHPSNLAQFEFHFETEPVREALSESMGGIDEMIAAMEEGNEANEREMVQAAAAAHQVARESSAGRTKATYLPPTIAPDTAYQFPTPDTEGDSPAQDDTQKVTSLPGDFSPTSMASPFVTASSTALSTLSKIIPSTAEAGPSGNRASHPTCLTMPTEAFVPPPPMCMFFSPAFKDLQKGKIGVWKGDLELRGGGGGSFSILIVGEESTGHFWQSHLWPKKIAYPCDSTSSDISTSSFTSKMIPVAYLAREGFTPETMGMVLCNDSKINKYVSMVQSLHSEGVAFHLPNSANLPIVFLPAKFDPSDPLQRLGLAFMSKPGCTLPVAPSLSTAKSKDETDARSDCEPKKKRRRRQSAPAKAIGTGHRRKESAVSSVRAGLRGGKIEQEVVVEETD